MNSIKRVVIGLSLGWALVSMASAAWDHRPQSAGIEKKTKVNEMGVEVELVEVLSRKPRQGFLECGPELGKLELPFVAKGIVANGEVRVSSHNDFAFEDEGETFLVGTSKRIEDAGGNAGLFIDSTQWCISPQKTWIYYIELMWGSTPLESDIQT